MFCVFVDNTRTNFTVCQVCRYLMIYITVDDP